MRRRIIAASVGVVLIVLLAVVPAVVVLLRRAAERELQVRLSSQASAISTAIADELLRGERPTIEAVAQLVPAGDGLEIVDQDGTVLLSYGPEHGSSVTESASGPLGTEVQLSANRSDLDRRVRGPLLALAAITVATIAIGVMLASILSRRLTRPLESLAHAATRLGAGDFSAVVPPKSGIAEIDDIATSLAQSSIKLDEMLADERGFTADATHQLRTGLTGIGLQLDLLTAHSDDHVRDEAGRARAQVDRLSANLDELVDVTRGGAGRQRRDVALGVLVADHCADWQARFAAVRRRLIPPASTSAVEIHATPGLVGQIVDILLDNSLRHGQGTVTVTLLRDGLTVADDGSLAAEVAERLFRRPSDAGTDPHGRGLVLARRLAEVDGGGVAVVTVQPTTFALRYPG